MAGAGAERPVGGLAVTAAAGVRVTTLRVLRDVLARDIEACDSSRDLAALSARLMAVLEEIDKLAPPAEAEGTVVDEIGKRRAARGAGSVRKSGSAGV